jgi:hypothetical protein
MIRFTITSGSWFSTPTLFCSRTCRIYLADGPKFLQVIYYTHSTEPDNPFTGLDARVLEENILRAVFNKALGRSSKFLRQLKINSNWLQTFSDVQQYS